MPIALVCGCSTGAGRLMMGPAGRPLINPSAMIIKTTAPPRGSKTINIATTMQLATIMLRGRLVRSARKPPEGTDPTETHNTMLIVDPAAAIDQHRRSEADDHGKADIEHAPDQARRDHGDGGVAIKAQGRRHRGAGGIGRRPIQGGGRQ